MNSILKFMGVARRARRSFRQIASVDMRLVGI